MEFSIPVPPATLSPIPPLERLPAGSELHRIHGVNWRSAQFNTGSHVSRFAPIADTDGRPIPVLYAGRTFEVAAYESLFHAVSQNQDALTWPASGLAAIVHSILETKRDLELAPLFRRNLIGWKVSDLEIVKAPARCYHQTARWAEAVHRSIAVAAGMVWISNREGSDRCYVFFGDRVQESDFAVSSQRRGRDETLLADVRQAALHSGIKITI
ncbi:MAG: RES family NAD+ phosphorylase [Deltaproteobacteria bacterium]|nr:RES family NAD+ phosphorylase [Deltaproteobacteria bacterium]